MGATSEDGTSSSEEESGGEEDEGDDDVEQELEAAALTSASHPSSRSTTPAFGSTTAASLIDELASASAARYQNGVIPDTQLGYDIDETQLPYPYEVPRNYTGIQFSIQQQQPSNTINQQ